MKASRYRLTITMNDRQETYPNLKNGQLVR